LGGLIIGDDKERDADAITPGTGIVADGDLVAEGTETNAQPGLEGVKILIVL
jgi:hypothetical protein